MLDYETLRIVWWLLLGIVIAGFAVTDGYDLGALIFLRALPNDKYERIALIETFEPMWEGHQVWFVLGGGATFAAWPLLYAASFSGFYFAMLLVLLALILRPVGLSVRAKMEDPRWTATWDALLTFSGVVPSLLFGVALGNLFLGVPLRYDSMLRMTYDGGLIGLLRPFALLCGLVSLSMLAMHGLVVDRGQGARRARAARRALASRGSRSRTPRSTRSPGCGSRTFPASASIRRRRPICRRIRSARPCRSAGRGSPTVRSAAGRSRWAWWRSSPRSRARSSRAAAARGSRSSRARLRSS
jgi:hypothetical protein